MYVLCVVQNKLEVGGASERFNLCDKGLAF